MHVINEQTGVISELQPGTGTIGLVDWSRDYFAFGSDRTASGSDNDYQFTGQRKEDGTALHHFEYRELSTTLRRWLAPDPMWLATPWQSPYVYASNNPINRIDLLGLIDDYQYDIMINGVPFMQGPDGHYYQVFTGSSRLRGQGYTPSDFYQEFVKGNSQAMAEYPQGYGGTIYDQPGFDYYNRNSGAGGKQKGNYVQQGMRNPGQTFSDEQMHFMGETIPKFITHLSTGIMGPAALRAVGGVGWQLLPASKYSLLAEFNYTAAVYGPSIIDGTASAISAGLGVLDYRPQTRWGKIGYTVGLGYAITRTGYTYFKSHSLPVVMQYHHLYLYPY